MVSGGIMKESQKLKLDAKNKRIFFGNGNCDEVRDLCEAICCRTYDVNLSEEEFRSGKYKARAACRLTGKECENKDSSCINRQWWLERRPGGSCVYLGKDNRCSIYSDRPEACKKFHCKEGWQISFAYLPRGRKAEKERKKGLDGYIMKTLKDDMKFIANPLTRLKTLFYSREKKELHFIKDVANKCGLVTSRRDFVNPGLGDKALMDLVTFFDGTRDLEAVRQDMNKKLDTALSKEDIYRIVWLFNLEGLIIFKHCASVFGGKH